MNSKIIRNNSNIRIGKRLGLFYKKEILVSGIPGKLLLKRFKDTFQTTPEPEALSNHERE